MSTRGLVKLRLVWKMMKFCAKGYTYELRKHRLWVRYDDRTFRLTKGAHDKKGEIQIGWIQDMVDAFDIAECAHGYIEMIKVPNKEGHKQDGTN